MVEKVKWDEELASLWRDRIVSNSKFVSDRVWGLTLDDYAKMSIWMDEDQEVK